MEHNLESKGKRLQNVHALFFHSIQLTPPTYSNKYSSVNSKTASFYFPHTNWQITTSGRYSLVPIKTCLAFCML